MDFVKTKATSNSEPTLEETPENLKNVRYSGGDNKTSLETATNNTSPVDVTSAKSISEDINPEISAAEDVVSFTKREDDIQAFPAVLDDALAYLDYLKESCRRDGDIKSYDHFLNIMLDFKSGAIDTPNLMKKVIGLFGTKLDLITRFKMFLPPGYEMELIQGTKNQAQLFTSTRTIPPNLSPVTGEKRSITDNWHSDLRESTTSQESERSVKRLKLIFE
jgi:histone deacetylase complex regulatory component SIN3